MDKGEISMRDSFFEELYNFAKKDRNIILVSADMRAPSIEKFKNELKKQYVDVGVAEQNALLIGAGLSHSGKKAFVYSIAPFVNSRIHEFVKLELGLMKLPVCIVGVGAGFSYADAGPTHHSVEDISIMRAIPNLEVLNPSDSLMAARFAKYATNSKNPCYIRIDRQFFPGIYKKGEKFSQGFKILNKKGEKCIVATGNMVHRALEVKKTLGNMGSPIGVIDLYKLKPINTKKLSQALSGYKKILTLEEHVLEGGLGSIISEIVADNHLQLKIKRMGVEGYPYIYGGRESMQKFHGLNKENIIKELRKI